MGSHTQQYITLQWLGDDTVWKHPGSLVEPVRRQTGKQGWWCGLTCRGCLDPAQHLHWQGAVSHYGAVYGGRSRLVYVVLHCGCLAGCCRADSGRVAAGFVLV